MTSGTRARRRRPHCGQAKVTSSMNGRCGSRSDRSRAGQLARARRSEPTQVRWSVLAAPDRQRGAPVAAAGQRPVDVVVQPVAVAAALDRLRVPVGLLVLPQQRVLDRGGADVPGRLRVVDQRRVAAPAVRVAVLVRHVPEQQAARLAGRATRSSSAFLKNWPPTSGTSASKRAVAADRVDHRQAVRAADREVVRAERGGLVDQTGAVLGRDVVGEHDVVAPASGNVDQRRTAAGRSSAPAPRPVNAGR